MYEIGKTVRKLLQHTSEAEQAMLELFQMLDDNALVNLRNLEDTYV